MWSVIFCFFRQAYPCLLHDELAYINLFYDNFSVLFWLYKNFGQVTFIAWQVYIFSNLPNCLFVKLSNWNTSILYWCIWISSISSTLDFPNRNFSLSWIEFNALPSCYKFWILIHLVNKLKFCLNNFFLHFNCNIIWNFHFWYLLIILWYY